VPAVTGPLSEPGLSTANRQPVTSTRTQAVTRTVQEPPPALSTPEQVVRSTPTCAENDSCFGDISSYTGRPKTVHVRGYYRKDGTYVRGHYRTPPRR
jgi:hypothetical protein